MTQNNISKIDKTILDNFYKLVHGQPNIRLTAASSTYKILSSMKKKPDKFNENLNYSVNRLVAGLASDRALARQGYGTLLMEILKNYQVTTERLFTEAQKKFGHISKETTRDNLIGYFLLISIVLESGNYNRNKANQLYLEKIYSLLMQLVNIKSYMEYPVAKILVQYYELLHPYMVADVPKHAFGSDSKLSATELLKIVLCNKKEPLRELQNMDSTNLMHLCSVLKDERFQKRPLHPVFLGVSEFMVKHAPKQFGNFYKTIIFPTFFKANHNELASMGLEYIASLIAVIEDPNAIKVLLDEHVVRMLILSLKNHNALYSYCVKFTKSLVEQFKELSERAKSGNKTPINDKQYVILLKLTSKPGSIAFDEDSKSTTINDLLQHCTPTVLKEYLSRIMNTLQKVTKKEDRCHNQHSCARQISYICRRPQLVEDQATLLKTAKYLLVASMFQISDDTKIDSSLWSSHSLPDPIRLENQAVRQSFKNSYHSVLDHLVSTQNSVQRSELLESLIDLTSELCNIEQIQHLGSTIEDDDNDKPFKDMWSAYLKSWGEHKKLIKKQPESKQLYPITSLFLFYGLQIIEHKLDCQSQLDELAHSSLESLKNDPSDGSWADVLTDQIIAILSATECNTWVRKLCESVFGSLLPHVSETSIDLICDAIRSPLNEEDTDGDSMDDSDEDEDEDTGSEEDDDEAANDEEISMEDKSDDEISDLEKNSDEENIDNDDMSVDDQSAESKSKESEKEAPSESDSEEYLDDDQMMKLDSVIADMFKLNRVGKKRDDPTFRLRCLDLIKKIVSKKHNDSAIINTILETVLPLASSSMRNTETRPIADKVITMLTKMPGKTKYPKLMAFLEKPKSKTVIKSRKTKKIKV